MAVKLLYKVVLAFILGPRIMFIRTRTQNYIYSDQDPELCLFGPGPRIILENSEIYDMIYIVNGGINMSIESEKLHIEELKREFSKKYIITVDDFNAFYRNVYVNISRKTVSWYIYDLKKKNIIKNVSRGQYVLLDNTKNIYKDYVVITMDVINSSNNDTSRFNYELENKVQDANHLIDLYYNYSRKFSISQGDEIQILCPFDDRLKYLLMIILCCLRPFLVRYAISIGEISDDIMDDSWYMNGPIFWNARDQLNKIKKSKEYTGLVISEYTDVDRYCNNILPLMNKSISRITDKQWEAIKFEVCNIQISQAINKMKISTASYYDRISVSNYHEIIKSIEAVFDIMKVRKYVI